MDSPHIAETAITSKTLKLIDDPHTILYDDPVEFLASKNKDQFAGYYEAYLTQ